MTTTAIAVHIEQNAAEQEMIKMREILFRAKTKATKEWTYGHFAKQYDVPQIYADNGHECIYEDTLCQYTGLTDKNGVKIFEGDIVRLYEDVKRAFNVNDGEVVYARGGFDVGDCALLSSLNAIASYNWVLRGEVIGNVHDNSGLLEGGME